MQTTVKKWFRDKDFGFLDNGGGPDILVRKANLTNCQYLRVGVTVEFECHADNRGLIAKDVRILRGREDNGKHVRKANSGSSHYFGVMK